MSTVQVDWSVECREGCGSLGEGLTTAEANRRSEKHMRDTKHPTVVTGLPVPARR